MALSRKEIQDRYRARWPELTKARDLFRAAKWRAKRFQLPFTITEEWVLAKLLSGKCEATGVELLIDRLPQGRGHIDAFTPSLDQRRPGRGYTQENTRLVSWGYNALKARGTDFETKRFIVEAAKNIRCA